MPVSALTPVPIRRAVAALRSSSYRSGYALLVNTAGATALGFVYWAVAARLYSSTAVGRGSALVSALILVSSVAQLNLSKTLLRFLPRAGRRSGRLIVCGYAVSSAVALAVGLAVVLLLPVISPRWRFVADSPTLAVAFVTAVVLWGVFALQDAVLLSLRRPVLVPAENIVYGVVKLILMVGLASVLRAEGIFLSWVVPLALTIPAVNWLIFRRRLNDLNAFDAARVQPSEIVRFAFLDYLGALLGQATGNVPPLLVLSTLGPRANGDFYIAWTIASGLSLAAANFPTGLLAEAAAAPDRLSELTRGVLLRCALVAVPGAALLALASRPILSLYGPGYAEHGWALLSLLAAATIPSSLLAITFVLDRLSGRVGRLALIRLVLAVLVLGGSWLLLPRLGIDGVGVAYGAAVLLVALARLPAIAAAVRARPITNSPAAGGHAASKDGNPQARRAGRNQSGGGMRAASRISVGFSIVRSVAAQPDQIRWLPRWLAQRHASPMAIRQPWWPYSATRWLATQLPSRARVFEYGGGGSSLWLQDRGALVTVVEHHPDWCRQLVDAGVAVAERPPTSTGSITSWPEPGFFDSYVDAIGREPDGSLDLVIVDGRARIDCVHQAIAKVKPGGLLLFDDTDLPRFLPATQLLPNWERHVFRGLKPVQHWPGETSVWRRPPTESLTRLGTDR